MTVDGKPLEEITELDFHKVDWNNLKHEEFHLLSAKLVERQRESKTPARSLGSKNKFILVTLRGKNYSIPETIYIRIKNSKSPGVKTKIIEEIITSYNPIESI